MIDTIREWLSEHAALVGALGIGSVVMLVGSAALVPFLVVRMPHDFFVRDKDESRFRLEHPVLRLSLAVARNVLGVVLLLAGIAMLVLPGQGLLTILLAVVVLDFPGKRRLELAIVRLGPIQNSLNWIRRRWNRPPLELPEPTDGAGEAQDAAPERRSPQPRNRDRPG